MEFKFNISNVANDEVMKIDNTLKALGHEKNDDLRQRLTLIIDEMGKASAVAQGLKLPVTSADKLANSDHILYMMTEHDKPEHFSVTGILKMGWKKLYLYNKLGLRTDAMVYCLLDFYIHESKQRKGYGKRLIEYMLQDINLSAKHLVIDKPTKNLLQFMRKNFQLSKVVNQGNNFVIYDEFFDEQKVYQNHDSAGNRTSGHIRPPTFGRHGAHKHHDSMGDIIKNTKASSSLQHNHDTNSVHSQLNEVRPHSEEALGSLQINKYGDCVERDIK